VLPSGLDAFVDHVIPILRSRGLFRRQYTGRTLREHYGLPRPENGFAPAASAEQGVPADRAAAAAAAVPAGV